jgi:hypothetical protein
MFCGTLRSARPCSPDSPLAQDSLGRAREGRNRSGAMQPDATMRKAGGARSCDDAALRGGSALFLGQRREAWLFQRHSPRVSVRKLLILDEEEEMAWQTSIDFLRA